MNVSIKAKEANVRANTMHKVEVSLDVEAQDFDRFLDENLTYILKYLADNHEQAVVESVEMALESYGYEEKEE
jgi:predicted metal-dependent hydrolase